MGLLDGLKSLFEGKMTIASRFELLREAISGTMSSFYMARDKKNGNIVGLKVLDLKKTKEFEDRFIGLKKPTEGEIGLKLKHPLLIRVLDHGLTDTGQQFIVMEFLDGPGLNSLIVAKSPLLVANRIKLIKQAGEALQAIHEAGYIHRDICPRNYVVAKDGKSLKLIDFGLTVPNTPEFTQPGNRTGTANYLAPEVVRRKKTDPRLDIFAFGVTAFEMCTFQLPWPKGDGRMAIQHDTVEPRDILQLAPDLNPQLAEAIMKCLASDPDKRPASMDQFLAVINRLKD
ncbi:MAG: serine/threonine-protein kinase [Planctomycetota bacterium]|nr:serine/threonine-protein kinase [Planctomycetota bacterium]